MLSFKQGEIVEVLNNRHDCTEVKIMIEGKLYKAINYEQLSGSICVGDKVVVNTTAIELGLGSGGYHFVITNLKQKQADLSGQGHIIKLRYTPMQHKVLSVEEEDSPYRQTLEATKDLGGVPVIAGELHSMIAPIALGIRSRTKKNRIIYIMTEGAALPLNFSKTVTEMLEMDIIQGTVTIGNAFGGNVEAVNIYSGLLAAKGVLGADIIVVAMGPGITGTGTKWGFSGVEQGQVLNAVATLGGVPITVPRISFSDPRKRHQGISHHTLTILKHVVLVPTTVPVANLPLEQLNIILDQWKNTQLREHVLKIIDTSTVESILLNSPIKLSTMGRNFEQDQAFFLTAAAAGIFAADSS